jgi:hypothetical protein
MWFYLKLEVSHRPRASGKRVLMGIFRQRRHEFRE